MPYGELYLPPIIKPILQDTKTNGRFPKGHTPHNKGKKWSEYMGKRAQKRASKGWKNLDIHRPKKRPDTTIRCSKPVIAVNKDGTWLYYPNITTAAKYNNCARENVKRCCKLNTTQTNTDHKCNGLTYSHP